MDLWEVSPGTIGRQAATGSSQLSLSLMIPALLHPPKTSFLGHNENQRSFSRESQGDLKVTKCKGRWGGAPA